MRRTAKKISLWLVYLVPKSNSSSKLSSVDYWLLSVTIQLNVFKRFRSCAVRECFIVRCDDYSSPFETMTMRFKGHITNYNLRPRFFFIACYKSSQTFPGKPSCRYFTAALLFWKLVTSSSGFHAANSKPSSRLEISLTQECGCSRCASTDSVTKTVLNV